MSSYAIVENGIVTNVVEWDGNTDTWSPPDGSQQILIEGDANPQIGLGYANGVFEQPAPPQLTPEQVQANNTAMRDALLAQAALAIAPLQDAVDLDEATDAETALLTQWKRYRVAVNRVDLTQTSPTWPTAPSS